MKIKGLIIICVFFIVLIIGGCINRNAPNIQTQNGKFGSKEELGEFNNNSSSANNVDYVGDWYAYEFDSDPDPELTILQKNDTSVVFSLSYLRLASFDNISAKVRNNIAKFTDEDNLISGTLEFTDSGISLSIDESNFSYIEPQKAKFKKLKVD